MTLGSNVLMSDEDFSFQYHKLIFKLACHEKQGNAFQTFFENIMELVDSSFVKVKPAGKIGDWKCDGWSPNTGTCYQVYAPEKLTNAKAAKKIKSDFGGAKNHWKDELKVWVFVWSHHDALPPQALSALQKLRKENAEQIEVDQWGRERLWEFVSEISHEKRIELLGNVPSIRNISDSNAAEVQALLNYLARNEGMEMDESDIGFTDLRDKIQRNRLGPAVRKLISGTLPVARVVEDYVGKHPDIQYSAIVASVLSKAYQANVSAGLTDPDEIFAELVRFVSCGSMEPKIYWSAVGIIVHYFQLCEIFDR